MSASVSPTLLVLAAGMGSRYGGLKQIDPVGPSGETIMDYSIYDALRAGFGKVVFIIRGDIEAAFRETIGARFAKHIAVDYVFQELDKLPAGFTPPEGRSKPWGTTQAVLMASQAIHEPFAVINADDFYGSDSYRALAGHLTSGSSDYAMVGFQLSKTLSDFGSVARGICQRNSESYLETVVEMTSIEGKDGAVANTDPSGKVTPLTGNELVSMNMWGLHPSVFPQLEGQFESFLKQSGSELKTESYLPSTVNALVQEGIARVKVLETASAWFGVTYREDRPTVVARIAQLVASGEYPESLWA
jgi:NDP-sugar pyrophosphorylase family protein